MLHPRVVLGTRRFLELEKQVDEATIETAYAFCVGLGFRPHWDSARETLYMHSPLKGRKVLVDVEAGWGRNGTRDGTDAREHTELVARGFEERGLAVGARVLRTGLKGDEPDEEWHISREVAPDFVVGLRPHLTPIEAVDFRLTYAFRQFMLSRRLATNAANHFRERFRGVRVSTYFLWNGFTDVALYHVLTRRGVAAIAFEWTLAGSDYHRGADAGAANALGAALFDAFEEALLAEEQLLAILGHDEDRLRRVLWEFELERRYGQIDGHEGYSSVPEENSRVTAVDSDLNDVVHDGRIDLADYRTGPRSAPASGQRHEGRAFASGEWTRSGELSPTPHRLSRMMLADPDLEQKGREEARRLRGG